MTAAATVRNLEQKTLVLNSNAANVLINKPITKDMHSISYGS